ncbi:DUF1641 domain-containing protein [Billgrantia ethanolica]|uniref:DUF1641 domain-containing protein n=1 Tax=Billgrantia ethanolica TaxID=2733486 RepID=UPI001F1A90BE|nr:DUF1641 domain-containing protein [Halomonas ethanolica]
MDGKAGPFTAMPWSLKRPMIEIIKKLETTTGAVPVLRLANDVVGANTKNASVVVDGLSKASTLNAIQNLAILGMMLSEVPPERFYRVTFAVKEALDRVGQHRPMQEGGDAPGVSGAYRMLNDDELWRGVAPLVDGLKAFSERLDKPVSDFFGKPTSGP